MKKKNLPEKKSVRLHKLMQKDSANHKVWVQFNEHKIMREAKAPMTNTSSVASEKEMLVHGSFTVDNNFMSAVN